MLAGFVAGEGCFTSCVQNTCFRDGSRRRKFVFAVEVADRDRDLLYQLRSVLGCGSVALKPSRQGHLPSACFSVRSHRAHAAHTIPFMDRYLLPCAKRRQYEVWKRALAAYEEAHPSRWGRGPSTCAVEGCDDAVRGRGLCRRHYHRETGY